MTTTDSVALVTGSARGLGQGIAVALAEAGHRVVLVARSTRETPNKAMPGSLEDVAESLEAAGHECLAIPADLANADDVDRVVATTLETWGRCDVVVNNAVYAPLNGFLDIPERRWPAAFAVNVFAPVAMCHAFMPGMLERGSGAIINIGSLAAVQPVPRMSLYGVTKAATERLTVSLHSEFGDQGILSYNIRIDEAIDTVGLEMVANRRAGEAPLEPQSDTAQAASAAINVGRRFTAAEFGAAVSWLLEQHPDTASRILTIGDLEEIGALPRRPTS
jgi:NAD(P)-dependent dehydrogenase (short-subunit alcohol dehydrogenase family)